MNLRILLCCLLLSACSDDARQGHFNGYADADWRYVAAPQAGWIVEQSVVEGAEVAVGDTLFMLDQDYQALALASAEKNFEQAAAEVLNMETGARVEELKALRAQRRSAEAEAELAASEWQRLKPLLAAGSVSKADGERAEKKWQAARAQVDNIKASMDVAELGARSAQQLAAKARRDAAGIAVEQARWQKAQREVKSLQVARVEEIFHFPGEFVTAGSPVLALLPPGAIKIRFYVAEAELASLKVGDELGLSWSGQSAAQRARIIFIADKAEFTPPIIFSTELKKKLVFLVEARPLGSELPRPGQPVALQRL